MIRYHRHYLIKFMRNVDAKWLICQPINLADILFVIDVIVSLYLTIKDNTPVLTRLNKIVVCICDRMMITLVWLAVSMHMLYSLLHTFT